MSGARTTVVVPTYDEAENLPTLVEGIVAHLPEARILVVDDASPDGTGELAEALGREHPGRRPASRRQARPRLGLPRRFPLGPGGGRRRARRDGRGPLPPGTPAAAAGGRARGQRPRGRQPLRGRWWRAGLAAASPGAVARREPRCAAVHPACRCATRPAASARSAARRSNAPASPIWAPTATPSRSRRALRVWEAGLRVGEVPFTFTDRRAGQSKLSRAVMLEALLAIPRWGPGLAPSPPRGSRLDGRRLRHGDPQVAQGRRIT